MTTLYTKDGCRPQPLPEADARLADGHLMMPLAGHPDAIAACGWVEAPGAPAIDEAVDQLGWDGAAWTIEPLAAEELAARAAAARLAARAAIEARGAAAFFAGYAPAQPAFAGERLQVRDGDDRTNWLTSQASYAAAVAAGFGDVVDASFRTAGNRTITVTYAEGLEVLLGMASWGRRIMARIWALKDADAAGEPYELESGWPA